MDYQIITDSCCDFTEEQYNELDITYVPLTVMWDGIAHAHFSTEAALREFYSGMRNGRIATSSALNPDNWKTAIIPFLRQGKDILVVAVSSAISCTYQSAVIAAEELKEQFPQRIIRVVDSRSGSLGAGLLVWMACKMRDAGNTLQELAEWLDCNRTRLCHWVTVDDLTYLKQSGRLSNAAAAVGSMLNMKPIINVTEEGKLVSAAKVRGRKSSIQMLAKKFAEYRKIDEESLVTIAHGDCLEDARALAEILKREYGVRNILINYVGPILGAHTGPGVLGLFHMGKCR